MDFKSRDTLSFLVLLLGHTVAAIALPGVDNETGLNLECTNDFIDRMFCQMERPNCSEYNLTLRDVYGGEERCIFQQCESGQCCCSVELLLIYRETYTARVWKGGHMLTSKTISVAQSIKPKAPEIVSVDDSDWTVKWKRHYMGEFRNSLTAEVTFCEKGSKNKITEPCKVDGCDELDCCQIPRGRLKPSTTYMVRVRTFTDWSGMFSDPSEEWEFITPSRGTPLLAIIISLSLAAVILTAAIYGCFVNAKAKWWDTVAKYPDPDLIFLSNKQEVFQVLKPVPPIISSIYIDPLLSDDSETCPQMPLTDTSSGSFQQSSGISTGSSRLTCAKIEHVDITAKEALCRDIPGISLTSPLTTSPLTDFNKDSGLISTPVSLCGFRADGMSSGSSGFDNKMYFTPIPRQITSDSSAVQMQAEIHCDSTNHPLCSISGGISTTTSCDVLSGAGARNEGSDKAIRDVTNGKNEDASICDKNLLSTCVPAESHSFLAVDDDYQAFPNLVGQPDALLSMQRSTEQEESLTNIPQSFSSTVAPGFKNNGQSGQHVSELQTPFLSLMSAGQSLPVMTDSGYQSV